MHGGSQQRPILNGGETLLSSGITNSPVPTNGIHASPLIDTREERIKFNYEGINAWDRSQNPRHAIGKVASQYWLARSPSAVRTKLYFKTNTYFHEEKQVSIIFHVKVPPSFYLRLAAASRIFSSTKYKKEEKMNHFTYGLAMKEAAAAAGTTKAWQYLLLLPRFPHCAYNSRAPWSTLYRN